MFSIKLMGGLGNQMFIYAFAKSVEKMGYPIAFIAQDYINSRYFESQDLKSALCSLQNRVNTTDNLNNASLLIHRLKYPRQQQCPVWRESTPPPPV